MPVDEAGRAAPTATGRAPEPSRTIILTRHAAHPSRAAPSTLYSPETSQADSMNRPLRTIALLGALAAALPIACTAQAPNAAAIRAVPPDRAAGGADGVAGLPDFTNLVQQVGPAVVSIRPRSRRAARVRGQTARRRRDPRVLPPLLRR